MKTHYSFIFIFFNLLAQLNAIPSSQLEINSEEASYDGHEIILTGDVTVEHDLGKIFAKHFSMAPSENKQKFSLSKLFMRDEVSIDFYNGGKLTCDHAEIDYANLYAIFLSSSTHPDVSFEFKQEKGKTAQQLPFLIKGTQLQVCLIKNEHATVKKQKQLFDHLQMDGRVRVSYGDEYELTAEHAFYQLDHLTPSDPFSGEILLTPQPGSLCQLTHKNGDFIVAEEIKIDRRTKQILFKQVHGHLAHQSTNSSQKLNFSANALIWNPNHQSFKLEGNVRVKEDNRLALKTDYELLINYEQTKEKKDLVSIFAPQHIEFTYQDVAKTSLRKLNCQGSFLLDHKNFKIKMESPRDAQGQVMRSEQVKLEDAMGEMYADQLEIDYTAQNGKLFTPSVIILRGHVQVFNRFNGHKEKTDAVLQYALADQLEYFPISQDMILTSDKGQRVLFFDKINQVQMSAPGLKIHHDKIKRKEVIQGIGDVRFTFIERESEQLKERFSLPENSL